MNDDEPIISPPFHFYGDGAQGAAADGETEGHEPAGQAPEVAPEPRFSPKSLNLLPSIVAARAHARSEIPPPPQHAFGGLGGLGGRRFAAAMALALGLGAGGGFWADHREAGNAAQTAQSTLDAVKRVTARLDQLEGRPHADEFDPRKLSADVKSSLAATRDLNAALAQVSARLDKIDREQTAKLEKLGERLDKAAVNRFADSGERLDRPDKRPGLEVTPAPAQPAGSAAAAPRAAAPLASARPERAISNETTGTISRPLAGLLVLDVRDNVALLQTRDGPQEVSPGDYLAGAGRIERIERRGKLWAVVTSLGVILSE